MKKASPTIDRFFRAMQTGTGTIDEMMALFTDDAVYVEPFSGKVASHSGRERIRAVLLEGWKVPLPEMTISVDRVDVDGDTVRAEWTCRSPGIPGGAGRGRNVFTLRGERIERLETTLLGGPA